MVDVLKRLLTLISWIVVMVVFLPWVIISVPVMIIAYLIRGLDNDLLEKIFYLPIVIHMNILEKLNTDKNVR